MKACCFILSLALIISVVLFKSDWHEHFANIIAAVSAFFAYWTIRESSKDQREKRLSGVSITANPSGIAYLKNGSEFDAWIDINKKIIGDENKGIIEGLTIKTTDDNKEINYIEGSDYDSVQYMKDVQKSSEEYQETLEKEWSSENRLYTDLHLSAGDTCVVHLAGLRSEDTGGFFVALQLNIRINQEDQPLRTKYYLFRYAGGKAEYISNNNEVKKGKEKEVLFETNPHREWITQYSKMSEVPLPTCWEKICRCFCSKTT